MSAISIRWLAVGFLLAMASVPAEAFDGHRKGFFMDVAIGPSLTSFRQDQSYAIQYIIPRGDSIVDSLVVFDRRDRQTQAGFSTNLMLGFGLNERVVVSYENRVAWFGSDEHATVATGVTGLAVSYFLSPAAPGFYVTGALGLGSWRLVEKGRGDSGGLGLSLAAGYEFRRHLALECAVSHAKAEDKIGSVETRALSGHVTLAWKGY
jgi:hypothetical protein